MVLKIPTLILATAALTASAFPSLAAVAEPSSAASSTTVLQKATVTAKHLNLQQRLLKFVDRIVAMVTRHIRRAP